MAIIDIIPQISLVTAVELSAQGDLDGLDNHQASVMTIPPKYRPDIDGLRALAVLPVLFFHAKIGCPGGYVGVDIFFVISGFLITSLILAEINTGTFSLIHFWERRIRRIVPALTTVVLATIVAGWFIFWPDDYKTFGDSVIWQALLLSNIYFWQMLNYFNPGGDTMPLLHTWSLAVEEQFYVLFPLLLIFLARYKRFSLVWTIGGLCLVSFVLSAAGVCLQRRITYYVLPTRAGELMVGAILASFPLRPWVHQRWNEFAGFLGLVLICWPVFGYTEDTPFPGLAAIPPCAGAALIIYSSRGRLSLVGRLLALKPLVYIGLISYSLYLWHWPLLTYVKYLRPAAFDWPTRLGVLASAVVLAAATWKFIETPFRQRKLLSGRAAVFLVAGGSQLALLLLGAEIYYDRGLTPPLSTKAAYYYGFRYHYSFRNEITVEQAAAGEFAEMGFPGTNQPVEIFLWGDSHAMAVAPVLDELCRRHSVRGMAATHSMTAPMLGFSKNGWFTMDDAQTFAQSAVNFVSRHHVGVVIIAARWDVYDPPDLVGAKLAATIKIIRASGARVYVLTDVPHPDFDVPRLAARTVYENEDPAKLRIPVEKHLAEDRKYEPLFQQAREAGAVILKPADYLLNPQGFYDIVRDNKLLYWDDNHLSVEGAMQLAPMFEPLFKKQLMSKSGD